MKLKTLMVAAVLASTVGANAYATTVNLTNTVGDLWTGTIGDVPALGSFTDVFTFSPSATFGSTAQIKFSNLSVTGLSTDPSAIIFTSATLNSIALTPTHGDDGDGDVFNGYKLPLTSVSGPLTLTIVGTSYGGSYSGTINLHVAPVPEPATYGMLLGGLGVLALVSRRRKQS
jgi:hypothetical protein